MVRLWCAYDRTNIEHLGFPWLSGAFTLPQGAADPNGFNEVRRPLWFAVCSQKFLPRLLACLTRVCWVG
jgi:hypothetical protein